VILPCLPFADDTGLVNLTKLYMKRVGPKGIEQQVINKKYCGFKIHIVYVHGSS